MKGEELHSLHRMQNTEKMTRKHTLHFSYRGSTVDRCCSVISHQRATIMFLYVSIVLLVVALQHSYVESIRLPTAAVAKAAYLTDHHKVSLRTKIASIVPDGAKNGLASALAAAVVKFALQPFDTLKTIQQMEKGNIGLLKTAIAFIETRGVLSLWSGVGVALIGSVPSVAVYFGVYNAAKSRLAAALPDRYRTVAVALAASIANTIASVIRAPNEVLNTRSSYLCIVLHYICIWVDPDSLCALCDQSCFPNALPSYYCINRC